MTGPEAPATAQVPDDLASALDDSNLREAFNNLDSQNRYAILHRIQTVKRADTRARAIEKFCGMIERGEKIHP